MGDNIKFKCVNAKRSSCFAGNEYCLKYKEGTTVKAPEYSMGIMVFKTRRNAECFQNDYSLQARYIIRVRCKGKGRVPVVLSANQGGGGIKSFYAGIKHSYYLNVGILFRKDWYKKWVRLAGEVGVYTQPAPEGTICYDEVEVLE